MREPQPSIWRPVVVMVLLMTVLIALRGYLPGAAAGPPTASDSSTGEAGSLIIVAVLLGLPAPGSGSRPNRRRLNPSTNRERWRGPPKLGSAEIGDESREPRAAIIACYAAMERELARVPEAAPQQFDTASEVLDRAVEHHALHAETATGLVELFGEARFSRHVMREEHRETAVQALRLVLRELRSLA